MFFTLEGDDCRRRLSTLVVGIDGVLFSESISAAGALVFAKACEMGCEGIVSKRVGSTYEAGAARTG
jgi:ATP-dependent DNA ligase